MNKLLLITGSRDITEVGLAYVRRAVQRAHQLNYEVIVGDASGVDEAVMQECHRLGMTCTVVGAYNRLRRRTASCSVYTVSGSYIQRDKYMAEQCDLCLAVWNGKSRGTKATYDFAVELGKTAWLKTFRCEDSPGERPAQIGGIEMTGVSIWTDGSGSGGRGPGGWACILRCGGWEREIRGHELDTTSQRMEIMATIRGLEALKKPCTVTVYTDSQYVIGVLSLGWKRKANHDLLAKADALVSKHTVSFEKVKAHNGDAMNERADELARWSLADARNLANGICHGCGAPLNDCTCEHDPDGPTLPRYIGLCSKQRDPLEKTEVGQQRPAANDKAQRVDFYALPNGSIVVTEMRRQGQRSIPLGEPTVATCDLASLLDEYEADGYTVRRWNGRARAWLGKPWMIRTTGQIQRMRSRHPHSQLDFAYDG